MPAHLAAERLQKVLSQLGLASRREAEAWIRAGRVTVNGKPAVLGMRVGVHDQLKLDGRMIRQHAPKTSAVFLVHRSPGEPLLPARDRPAVAGESSQTLSAALAAHGTLTSIAARLPRRAGLRFVSISPMPTVDGGLELLSADGAVAERLQRAVHGWEMEFSLRVRGELAHEQQSAIRQGMLDRGTAIHVVRLEASGGEASNRWYRLVAVGASGNNVRQLIERAGVTLVRVLRTRLGVLELPRTLARSRWRELSGEEIAKLTARAAPTGLD